MSNDAAAFAAVRAIEQGQWDRYLVRIQAAIRQRQRTDEYKAHIVAGRDSHT